MATPLVSKDDFTTWLGEEVDPARAELVISGVSGVVRSETGRTWLTDEGGLEDVPDDVRTIVLQVATRVWHNPVNAQSKNTGPFTLMWDRETGIGVTLSDAERAALARYQTGGNSAVWVLGTTRGDMETRTTWAPTVYAATGDDGEPMPW